MFLKRCNRDVIRNVNIATKRQLGEEANKYTVDVLTLKLLIITLDLN